MLRAAAYSLASLRFYKTARYRSPVFVDAETSLYSVYSSFLAVVFQVPVRVLRVSFGGMKFRQL